MKLVYLPFKSTENRREYCRVGSMKCVGIRLIGSFWLLLLNTGRPM